MANIEILAPVGSEEMLRAAVFSGADAVYLGFSGFNARTGAGNFDADTLKEAVRFCHARGVAVHVALNTAARSISSLPTGARISMFAITLLLVCTYYIASAKRPYACGALSPAVSSFAAAAFALACSFASCSRRALFSRCSTSFSARTLSSASLALAASAM